MGSARLRLLWHSFTFALALVLVFTIHHLHTIWIHPLRMHWAHYQSIYVCLSICLSVCLSICAIGPISIDDFIAITRTKYFSAIHLLFASQQSVPFVIVLVALAFVIVGSLIISQWHKPGIITTQYSQCTALHTANCWHQYLQLVSISQTLDKYSVL